MVKRLRRRPFTAKSRVRFPIELLIGFIPITGMRPFLYLNACATRLSINAGIILNLNSNFLYRPCFYKCLMLVFIGLDYLV